MPSSYDIRSAAWGRMKGEGALYALAGFAIIFMLAMFVEVLIRQFGLAQGFVVEIPICDFLRSWGLAVEPEVEQLFAGRTIAQPTLGYQAFSIVVQVLWNGVLSFGGAVLAISVMRGCSNAFQALSGFRWPFRTVGLGALRALLILLWSLMLVIPGFCAAYSYRMAFYLLADNPDWSPWKALQESKRIMYGHRWRLACLDASFIGWFLLVAITMGLAGIFVTPYYATANAAFYEDLLDRDADGNA